MVNKHANRGSISSSRKNKIIIHIATHSQESLKLKRQYLELTRMGSNQNTQSLSVRMCIGTFALQNCLTVFIKAQHVYSL